MQYNSVQISTVKYNGMKYGAMHTFLKRGSARTEAVRFPILLTSNKASDQIHVNANMMGGK